VSDRDDKLMALARHRHLHAATWDQPLASLIAVGAAKQLTRVRWRTGWRGEIAIHSSERIPHLCEWTWADDYTTSDLPRAVGAILAVGYLVGVTKVPGKKATYEWTLEDVRQLDQPVSVQAPPGIGKRKPTVWMVPEEPTVAVWKRLYPCAT